ncbi:MAG TPA: hypothetical protein VGO62_20885, partial [Myxococcota bacterium]
LTFWASSLFWATPFLLLGRSLSVFVSLPIAFFTGTAGRMLAGHGMGVDVVDCAAASAALLPALIVDRVVQTWLPTASLLTWPCALVVVQRALMGQPSQGLLAPLPHLDSVLLVRGTAGDYASIFVVAVFASGFAAIASVLNRRVRDPYPQDQRERGVRIASITSFVLAFPVFIAGALVAVPSGDPPVSDAVPVGAGVIVVGLVVLALVTWRRRRSLATA